MKVESLSLKWNNYKMQKRDFLVDENLISQT